MEKLVTIAFTLLILAGCSPKTAPVDNSTEETLSEQPNSTLTDTNPVNVYYTTPENEKETCLCVATADTPVEQQRGLMHITNFGPYDGMLFTFDAPVNTGFWMKNTPTPLHIGWFTDTGELAGTANMVPCVEEPCDSYNPNSSYSYAVEIPSNTGTSFENATSFRVGEPCKL